MVETERAGQSHRDAPSGWRVARRSWSLDIPVGWELDGPYATVVGPDAVAIGLVHVGGSDVSESVVVAFDRHSGSSWVGCAPKVTSGHWAGTVDRVVVRVGDRGVLGWSPTTTSLQRLLLLPAPGPGRASPAVLGVSLPGTADFDSRCASSRRTLAPQAFEPSSAASLRKNGAGSRTGPGAQ